jgi:hypothetical protein
VPSNNQITNKNNGDLVGFCEDIINVILGFLDAKSLGKLGQVNRFFQGTFSGIMEKLSTWKTAKTLLKEYLALKYALKLPLTRFRDHGCSAEALKAMPGEKAESKKANQLAKYFTNKHSNGTQNAVAFLGIAQAIFINSEDINRLGELTKLLKEFIEQVMKSPQLYKIKGLAEDGKEEI